ncbi:MAG TPA: chemotaxis protein CheB, partial [Bacteroidales bacterium]|nr:chemotaxis protein CheB [Bacteroidales bacterium]
MSKRKKSIKSEIENTFNDQNGLVIVGIGASAGGLEAIQDFFAKMPSNTGLAFVVIQHLSPAHKSMMDELLAKYTKMKILVV